MTAACKAAAQKCLASDVPSRPRKPWISGKTLELLEQRVVARKLKDVGAEKGLTAAIIASVKRDRTGWAIRKLA